MYSIRALLYGATILLVFLLSEGPVQAQDSNGAKIVQEINKSEDVVSDFSENNICSSTYFSDASLLDQCEGYLQQLEAWIDYYKEELAESSLTVAKDATIENSLYANERGLQTILEEAGYSYTADSTDTTSSAFSIEADDVDSSACTSCDKTATAQGLLCGAVTAADVPAGGLCFLGAFIYYEGCVMSSCSKPSRAPLECS